MRCIHLLWSNLTDQNVTTMVQIYSFELQEQWIVHTYSSSHGKLSEVRFTSLSNWETFMTKEMP